jgi:hypothetical protein
MLRTMGFPLGNKGHWKEVRTENNVIKRGSEKVGKGYMIVKILAP